LNKRIEDLLGSIRELEKELKDEVERIRIETYEIRDRSVRFKDEVTRRHKTQVIRLYDYLRHAQIKHIVTAPVIWFCIFPALFMDLVVTVYQTICFPVYGIPKVKRRDYIVIDRHFLGYLNIIEKANCVFCGYFGGVVAFAGEVAARTEQYWCPIKHASRLKSVHSRYKNFAEYGDSDQFRENFMKIRVDFSDLKEEPTDKS
jgi:hypothetical protein